MTSDALNMKADDPVFLFIRKACDAWPDSEWNMCTSADDLSIVIPTMIQDGFVIISNPSNTQLTYLRNHSFDFVQLGDVCLVRNNKPRQIAWLPSENALDGPYDFNNTVQSNMQPLYKRMMYPKMVDHSAIIAGILKSMATPESIYIEYGIMAGVCVERCAPHVKQVHAVDISHYSPIAPNVKVHQMLTDTFSTNHLPSIKFQFAFIDADHHSKQVFTDFEHIYNNIDQGGVIFLHDTYPSSENMLQPNLCHDCFKSQFMIRKAHPDVQMITLPLNPGLTIVVKPKTQ
jgi:hypothetical protein